MSEPVPEWDGHDQADVVPLHPSQAPLGELCDLYEPMDPAVVRLIMDLMGLIE